MDWSESKIYFQLGVDHITDLAGYDHILFVVTLCSIYALDQWRRIAILVTAFTLGHSLTLALTVLDLIQVSSYWIEVLIPVTIALTAISNILFLRRGRQQRAGYYLYALAAFFGLIHGCGFSSYLKAILGDTGQVLLPLLSFNVGIEIGQLWIVCLFLLVAFVLKRFPLIGDRGWRIGLNAISFCWALWLMLDRIQAS